MESMLRKGLYELQQQEKEGAEEHFRRYEEYFLGQSDQILRFLHILWLKTCAPVRRLPMFAKSWMVTLSPFIKAYLNWHANGEKPLNVADAE